ncbi:MAG: hypothetical protein LBU47_05770 [Christensenellaceae bacterium]|nr:hypothetical protein [Christensenellaceae bacterium]
MRRAWVHPKYALVGVESGYRFRFFCALCGANRTSGWISAASEADARLFAEAEARRFFNGCHKCGRWICDEHYNADEMMCVECAPRKGRAGS